MDAIIVVVVLVLVLVVGFQAWCITQLEQANEELERRLHVSQVTGGHWSR